MAAVVAGAALGAVAGIWLGGAYVDLYGAYFDFPHLDYHLSPLLLVIATAVSVLAAAAGALLAVRRAALLPPAEAMRPEPPASFEAGWLERSGLARALPSSAAHGAAQPAAQAAAGAAVVARGVVLGSDPDHRPGDVRRRAMDDGSAVPRHPARGPVGVLRRAAHRRGRARLPQPGRRDAGRDLPHGAGAIALGAFREGDRHPGAGPRRPAAQPRQRIGRRAAAAGRRPGAERDPGQAAASGGRRRGRCRSSSKVNAARRGCRWPASSTTCSAFRPP